MDIYLEGKPSRGRGRVGAGRALLPPGTRVQSTLVPSSSCTSSVQSGSMRSEGRWPALLAASLSAPREMRYLGANGRPGGHQRVSGLAGQSRQDRASRAWQLLLCLGLASPRNWIRPSETGRLSIRPGEDPAPSPPTLLFLRGSGHHLSGAHRAMSSEPLLQAVCRAVPPAASG